MLALRHICAEALSRGYAHGRFLARAAWEHRILHARPLPLAAVPLAVGLAAESPASTEGLRARAIIEALPTERWL